MASNAVTVPIGFSDYGAIELKKNYQKFFRRGLEYAIIVHILLISSFILINSGRFLYKYSVDGW